MLIRVVRAQGRAALVPTTVSVKLLRGATFDQENLLSDTHLQFIPDFISADEADGYFHALQADIEWRQDRIKLFGKVHNLPRLHQWYADDGLAYQWSGLKLQPQPWIRLLVELRARVEQHTGHRFNSVLANLYRDGNDSMGWHADDEPELGESPVIASISLGATRDFHMRQKVRTQSASTRTISLLHGSLLLMSGTSQRDWLHSLPKRKRVTEPRINLTFRQIIRA